MMSSRPLDEAFVADLKDLVVHGVLLGARGPLPAGAEITKELHFDQKKVAKQAKASLEDWHLLREEVAGSLGAKLVDNYRPINEARRDLYKLVKKEIQIERKLQCVDAVMQDFKIILYGHHVDGEQNLLGHQLRTVYKAGGLPCGWLGKYPKGRLIVYWPYDEEPTFHSVNPTNNRT